LSDLFLDSHSGDQFAGAAVNHVIVVRLSHAQRDNHPCPKQTERNQPSTRFLLHDLDPHFYGAKEQLPRWV
jgi:hypothetical protein